MSKSKRIISTFEVELNYEQSFIIAKRWAEYHETGRAMIGQLKWDAVNHRYDCIQFCIVTPRAANKIAVFLQGNERK